jgi:aryl-alcohol dehydrogenase-like predicted oxidoreductase
MSQHIKLILGTAQFKGEYGSLKNKINEDQISHDILTCAKELGIKTLDTALNYGNAHSIISNSLQKFELHTKISLDSKVLKNLELTLQTLRVEKVEVLYIHDPIITKESQSNYKKLLKYKGLKFEKLGISVYNKFEFKLALDDNQIDVIQFPFNVLNRQIDYVSRSIAYERGKCLIARSVFLQGLLNNELENKDIKTYKDFSRNIKEFQEIALKNKMNYTEACIKFIRSQEFISGVIIGVVNTLQLRKVVNYFMYPEIDQFKLSDILDIPQPDAFSVDPRNW